MAGLWSDHFPASGMSPEILPGSCNSIGAWSEHFPSKPSPSAALSGYERCLLCRTCGVSCRLYTSKSSKNPNRQYYKCLASPDHDFFKWADEVRPDEFIDVPDCGGCGAGTCRVKREKRGPNSGRVLFMCRIKEGEGSCGYRVWQDELQKSATKGPNENITLSQSPTINTNFFQENSQSNESTVTDASLQHPDFDELTPEVIERLLFVENQFNDQRIADESVTLYPSATVEENNESNHMGSPVISTLQQMECQENTQNESPSRRPFKRSRHGDLKAQSCLVSSQLLTVVVEHRWVIAATRENLSTQLKGWWGRLAFRPMPSLATHASKPLTCCVSSLHISGFTSQDILVKSMNLTTLTKTLDGSEAHNKPLLNPCHSTQLSYTNPPRETSFQTLLMSESISKAFTHAAENLQNDFLALLEKMDVSDYEAMRRESEATFSALDRLQFNYRDLKDRTEEYISCSISLAESMFGHESYRERIEHYSRERMRLDEVRSDYAKASERLKSNRKRLRSLQGMVSSTKDWLVKVEDELCRFEVEMRDSERDLEKIWKEKEELEEKNAAAGRELEEIMERKEGEREAAKAALENARVLLRGGDR